MSATCIFEGAREASITLINIAAFSETEPEKKTTKKQKKNRGKTKKRDQNMKKTKKAAFASGVSAYFNSQLKEICNKDARNDAVFFFLGAHLERRCRAR